jgi:hypothetical protein
LASFEHHACAVSRLRTGGGLQELPIRRPGFGHVCRPDALSGHRAKRVLARWHRTRQVLQETRRNGDIDTRFLACPRWDVHQLLACITKPLRKERKGAATGRRCDRKALRPEGKWPRLIFFQELRPSIQPCIRAVDARAAHCAVPSTLRSR